MWSGQKCETEVEQTQMTLIVNIFWLLSLFRIHSRVIITAIITLTLCCISVILAGVAALPFINPDLAPYRISPFVCFYDVGLI